MPLPYRRSKFSAVRQNNLSACRARPTSLLQFHYPFRSSYSKIFSSIHLYTLDIDFFFFVILFLPRTLRYYVYMKYRFPFFTKRRRYHLFYRRSWFFFFFPLRVSKKVNFLLPPSRTITLGFSFLYSFR